MFSKFAIDFETNPYDELSTSSEFEDITKGRQGAILVDYKDDNTIPIVRTTTVYKNPVQKFLPIHYNIIEQIQKQSGLHELSFNNAMIEIYDSKYTNMKYHSDQALDLILESYICIFSCYNDSSPTDIRKLKIKNKLTYEYTEFTLEHNSIIIFPLSTNQKFLHKIVLETNIADKKWLGLTFRLSKTYIKFVDEIPYFRLSGVVLRMADKDDKKEFMKCRGLENLNTEYTYPTNIDYTISASDMMSIR